MIHGQSRFRSGKKTHKRGGNWSKRNNTTQAKSNRFVVREKPEKKFGIGVFLLILFLAALIISLAWLILYSEYLQIADIEINGNRYTTQEPIRKLAINQEQGYYWFLIPKTNLLLYNSQELAAKLDANFQLVSSKIVKNYIKRTLIINLVEKDYDYIWQEGEQFYYINRAGDIIMVKSAPSMDYVVVVNTSPSLVNNRTVKIDVQYLDYAKDLDEALRNNNRGLSQRTFLYDGTINAIKVKLTGGPTLYFNIEEPIGKQLDKLDALRKNELRDGQLFNSLGYIDLRFGNRIFYQ